MSSTSKTQRPLFPFMILCAIAACEASVETEVVASKVSRGANTSAASTTPTALLSTPATITNSKTLPVTVAFSEAVAVFEATDVSVTNGSVVGVSGSGESFTVDVTAAVDGAVTIDLAGRMSEVAADALIVVYDSVAPGTVLATTSASPTRSNDLTFTTAFSEIVTGFELSDVAVTNGVATGLEVTDEGFTFHVTPTAAGEVTVSILSGAAADAAGNASTESSTIKVTYDANAASVALSTSAASTVSGNFSVTATFSESVTGLALSDFELTNASASNFAGTGTVYTFDVTPTASGVVKINLPADAATDAAGNGNLAATELTLTADLTGPTLTLSSGESAVTMASSFSVTATFSEDVTGFDLSDVTATNATTSNLSGSGAIYTFDVTPSAPGTVTIAISSSAATDVLGNPSLAAANLTRLHIDSYPSLTSAHAVLYGTVAEALSYALQTADGEAPYTYSLPSNPGSIASINASGVLSITPMSSGDVSITARVTDALGQTDDLTLTVTTRAYRTCVWSGTVSTAWATASNWTFCNGSAPTSSDWIAIDEDATYQPILDATLSVQGVASSIYKGGALTVNAGRTLTLSAANGSIASSIRLAGSTATCTTCIVLYSGHMTVNSNATLTLGSGIELRANDWAKKLLLGDGSTAGHLVTDISSSDVAEWPVLSAAGVDEFVGIELNGSASVKSSVSINGLSITIGRPAENTLNFVSYWSVQRLDNVRIATVTDATLLRTGNGIKLAGCSNSEIIDTTWSAIEFVDPVHIVDGNPSLAYANIYATGCSGVGPVSVSGSGLGFGQSFEIDGSGIINWVNGTSYNCVWNGSTSTSWTDPANWTDCTNGRNNYPDHNDTVVIQPLGGAVGFQPAVTDARRYLYGVGPTTVSATGGGAITVAAGAELLLLAAQPTGTTGIRSDVTFKGDTPGCLTCNVSYRSFLTVSNNATLTLETGIAFQIIANSGNSWLFIGNTSSAGHLVASGGGTQSEWPRITTPTGFVRDGIRVRGTSSVRSSVHFDGVKILNNVTTSNSYAIVRLESYYRVKKFDNVYIDGSGATSQADAILITCSATAGATVFDDTTWTGVHFVDSVTGLGTNIDASSANCTTGNGFALTISGDTSTSSWGAAYASDPNAILTWTP